MQQRSESEGQQPRIKSPAGHVEQPFLRHQGCSFVNRPRERASEITRRRFLGQTAAGVAGLALGPHLLGLRSARAGNRNSKIVRAWHPNATTGWTQVNQVPVDMMVHAAIRALTGIGHTGMAWASLFPELTVDKTVGIKINLSCGDVPTHPEVVNAIIDGLLMIDLNGLQLPEENIYVWDNDSDFFCAQTGYSLNYGGPGVQYLGTDYPGVGFDYSLPFTIDHPDDRTTTHYPSRILSQFCDFMINAAVIKDHNDAGVTLSLKNNYGSFSGIAVWELHVGPYGDGHTRGEPELNRIMRDDLGDKTKLWLIDATYGLFDGGPGFTPPGHTPPNWRYNSFLVGTDPVALDRIGTEKINAERGANGLDPLDPSHIPVSAGPPYNLGTDDLAQIDLVEIDASLQADVTEDSLGPNGIMLLAPFPNPARDGCTLRLRCARPAEAEITITDASGGVIRRIAGTRYPSGVHELVWDGKDEAGRRLPSGAYFCRLRTREGICKQRVILIH
jgi:hypothetical protein